MANLKSFRSCESYLHKYAKDVFASWILEKVASGSSSYYIFDWKAECRVKLEYPIWSRMLNDKKEIFGVDPIWSDIPDRECLLDRGFHLEAVIDIAICDGSRLKYCVEIVHTHKTPQTKLQFLKTCDVPVYEISATWIMNQVRRPPKLDLLTRC